MSDKKTETPPKRPYEPPKVTTEPWLVNGISCNGTTAGGRKASTGTPNFCNSLRLLS